eukprot:5910426-Amphidinium_carterae.1
MDAQSPDKSTNLSGVLLGGSKARVACAIRSSGTSGWPTLRRGFRSSSKLVTSGRQSLWHLQRIGHGHRCCKTSNSQNHPL